MIPACSLSLVHCLSCMGHYSIQDGKDDFLLLSTHIRKMAQPYPDEGNQGRS